jgi:uncharacterized protein YjiS (DUF1127 family)
MNTAQTRAGIVPAISRTPARRPLAALAAWLNACIETGRQRHALSLLTDDELRDIGLSRADVARECGRWPWDSTSPGGRGRAPAERASG